jgi:hypothetical protein
MVLSPTLNGSGGSTQQSLRFNGDTASNYGRRYSPDGGSDSANQANRISTGAATQANSLGFTVGYVANKSNKEKLAISHGVDTYGTTASNAPRRYEAVGKWANTSDAINSITIHNPTSGDFQSGSECVVLGWDDSDTHTTNFWEELASVDLSGGASTNLSSGTISAKKYLWVQFYGGFAGSANHIMTFNNDTASNYATRRSIDGAADGTFTSESEARVGSGSTTANFSNIFIINNSANEKMGIAHQVSQNTAGAANAPRRREDFFKWANTSAQITEIDLSSSTANTMNTHTTMKVWGSD